MVEDPRTPQTMLASTTLATWNRHSFTLFLKVLRERHTTGEPHFGSASRFHTFVLAEAALRSGSRSGGLKFSRALALAPGRLGERRKWKRTKRRFRVARVVEPARANPMSLEHIASQETIDFHFTIKRKNHRKFRIF